MFLIDYQKAVNYLISVVGCASMCFKSVVTSPFGNCFIFNIDNAEDACLRVFRGGLIDKVYSDTWRNPDHREIITKGNEKEIW